MDRLSRRHSGASNYPSACTIYNNTSSGAGLEFGVDHNQFYFGRNSDPRGRFEYYNSPPIMVLQRISGNVGIGTADPVSKPSTAPPPASSRATHTARSSPATRPSGYTGDLLNMQIAGSSKFRVDKDGKIYGDASTLSNIPGGLSGLTTGRIPFATSATSVGDDARLFWDNTNKRLGVGTTSPGYLVEVGSSAVADTPTLAVRGTGANSRPALAVQSPGAIWSFRVQGNDYSQLIFDVNAVPAATFSTSGNFGIGLGDPYIQPSSRLTVNGNAAIGYANGAAPASGLAVSGSVGIGTTAPYRPLTVAGAARVLGDLEYYDSASAAGTMIWRITRGVGGLNNYMQIASLEGMTFSTGGQPGAEKMRIESNGNVGFGTSSPGWPVTISQNAGAEILHVEAGAPPAQGTEKRSQ